MPTMRESTLSTRMPRTRKITSAARNETKVNASTAVNAADRLALTKRRSERCRSREGARPGNKRRRQRHEGEVEYVATCDLLALDMRRLAVHHEVVGRRHQQQAGGDPEALERDAEQIEHALAADAERKQHAQDATTATDAAIAFCRQTRPRVNR